MTADPNEAFEYLGRGRALAGEERFDDSIEQFRTADELWQRAGSQDRKLALCNWADALREQEHYDEAAGKCQEAIRVDPDYADAYFQLGRVLADQELVDHAIERYPKRTSCGGRLGRKSANVPFDYWGDALLWLEDYKQAAGKCAE